DGVEDLAVYDASGNVSVLLGSGGGAFAVSQTIAVGKTAFGSGAQIVAADLDGDQSPDVALVAETSSSNTASLYLLAGSKSGMLTLKPAVTLTSPSGRGVVAGDFDGDGKIDLAAYGGTSGNISLLTNTGGFAFTESEISL